MVCIALTAIIMVVSLLATAVALIATTDVLKNGTASASLTAGQIAFSSAVFQIAIIVTTIALIARLRRYVSGNVVPMSWPRHGALVILVLGIGTFALSSGIGMAINWLSLDARGARVADPLLQLPVLWMFIVIGVIGAPLSEELLFRGFLYAGLRESPLGFWGTAIVTSLVWAAWHGLALHIIVPVFCVGIVFAWVREKTGSIWPTIGAHAIYNGLLALMVWVYSTQTLA